MASVSGFIKELQRRNVFRSGVVYLVVAWLLVQVSDILLETFTAPAWVMRAVVIALAVGFPVVLILAWVYEITTQGVKRTERVSEGESISPYAGRQIDFAIIGVLLVAVALFAADRFRWVDFGTESAIGRRSIAVLPFVNRSANADDVYFVDGIHDDLLSSLAKIRDLLVISRTSVMRYRDTTKPIPEIARELGVSTVLEGGVQRAGGQVRISVQLIDARTDEHIWADTFDRELTADNVFAIQSEIAETIVTALAAALTPEERQRLERQPTENLEAYNAILLGNQRLSLQTVEGYAQAETYYRRALELDPDYAVAWERLAKVLFAQYGNGTHPKETILQARDVVKHALELDDQLGPAWVTLSMLEFELNFRGRDGDLDDEQIQDLFERALEMSPNNVEVYGYYALFLFWHQHRPDLMMEMLRKAVSLDPLSVNAHRRLAVGLRNLMQFEEAQQIFARVRELEPYNPYGYWDAGRTYWESGKLADAIIWMEKAQKLDKNDPDAPFVIAQVALDLGDPGLAAEWIEEGFRMDPEHRRAEFTKLFLHLVREETSEMWKIADRQLSSEQRNRVQGVRYFRELLRDRDIDNGEPQLALARYREQSPALFLDTVPIGQVNTLEVIDLAYLLQLLGQPDRATILLEQALTFNQGDLSILSTRSRFELNQTEILALLGRKEEAIRHIRLIDKSDWPQAWPILVTRRSLDPIRDTPEFRDLVQRLEAQRSTQRNRYARLVAEEDEI